MAHDKLAIVKRTRAPRVFEIKKNNRWAGYYFVVLIR